MPQTAVGNLKLILAALKEHNPAMPVVLCTVFPSSETKKRPAAQIKKINQLYFAAIKDQPQVTVLDTWSLFADARGDAKLDEFPDQAMPNAGGYLKWTAALRPVMETLGLSPAWPDDRGAEPGFESLFNGRDLTGWSYAEKAAFDGNGNPGRTLRSAQWPLGRHRFPAGARLRAASPGPNRESITTSC